jgi:hypothetical protein
MPITARSCPRCGSPSLQPVQTLNGVHLFCGVCHRCWTPEFRYLIEVNRYACPGCDDRTRCRPV